MTEQTTTTQPATVAERIAQITPPRQPQRVHRNTVRAQLRRGEVWKGYLAGNNVNGWHITNGWHLGHYVEIATIEELEKISTAMLIYLDKELGTRIVCWA